MSDTLVYILVSSSINFLFILNFLIGFLVINLVIFNAL